MDDDDLPIPTLQQRLRRVVRDVLSTALLAVGLLVGVGWLRSPDLPERAPDFTLPALDGRTLSLSQFAGRTVVLNFWATWCGPCRMEAPTLASFATAHPDIVVLGIAEDSQAGTVRRAVGQLGITYPVLLGSREVLETYGISTYPTTVFVNSDGEVRWTHTGLILRPQLAWTSGVLW